LPPVGV